MTPRTRLVRFAAAACLIAVAVAASGCSSTLADAATVNTTHISRSDLNDDLDHLVSNADFKAALEQSGGYKLSSNSETVDVRLAATWLSLLVQQVAIDEEFEARHLKVTAQDTAQAR